LIGPRRWRVRLAVRGWERGCVAVQGFSGFGGEEIVGFDTILVLIGSRTVEEIEKYPCRPGRDLPSIADASDLI
jgi:hypothetical protein